MIKVTFKKGYCRIRDMARTVNIESFEELFDIAFHLKFDDIGSQLELIIESEISGEIVIKTDSGVRDTHKQACERLSEIIKMERSYNKLLSSISNREAWIGSKKAWKLFGGFSRFTVKSFTDYVTHAADVDKEMIRVMHNGDDIILQFALTIRGIKKSENN